MLSARACAALGEAFEQRFAPAHRYVLNKDDDEAGSFLAFVSTRQYPAWYIAAAQIVYSVPRAINESVLKLHDGELQARETRAWSVERRRAEGQALLHRLAEDLLAEWDTQPPADASLPLRRAIQYLLHSLEQDGYYFANGRLQVRATDAK
jgi:hypothetical protein